MGESCSTIPSERERSKKTSNVKREDQLLANITAKWINYETLKRNYQDSTVGEKQRREDDFRTRISFGSSYFVFSPSFLLAMAMWVDVFLSSPDHL